MARSQKRSASRSSKSNPPIPPPFEMDVLCGRGKSTSRHAGNQHFRKIVQAHIDEYIGAITKLEKSMVVTKICNQVRERGEFVKLDEDAGAWVKVTERMAREKVGQVLRDALHMFYKSSSAAKQRRRKVDLANQTKIVSKLLETNKPVSAALTSIANKISNDQSDQRVLAIFYKANIKILEELKKQRQRLNKELSEATEGDILEEITLQGLQESTREYIEL